MKVRPVFVVLWVALLLVLVVLHFVHLQADFPNYSRWMDWSKYTDEGWYANAAVEQHLRGSWHVAGDLNTAVAVPVWPLIEWALFFLTGVSIEAARALAVALFTSNLALSFLLVRKGQPLWVALLSSSLIASSSFLYCFSRLAILEPLLIFLTLLAILIARNLGAVESTGRRYALAAVLGLLLCLMVLTKTTAIFLLPAVLYSLWYPMRKQPGNFAAYVLVAVGIAASLWSGYFFLLVRPHYLADYRYFFHVNLYMKPSTIGGWLKVMYYAWHGILWVDWASVLAGIVAIAVTSLVARPVWRNPLFVSAILAIGGYVLFITDICNMQPRYYVVIAFFLFLALPLALSAILRQHRVAGWVALGLCCFGMAKGAWEEGGYVLYPEYTFVNAARGIADYIDNHPEGNRLLVSVSGNEIGLITGLPSVCDDFGTMRLAEKVAMYRPGWYAAWNDLDPGIVQDLQVHNSLLQVASFKAFDDDDRDTLVLYKLTTPDQRPADVSSTSRSNAERKVEKP